MALFNEGFGDRVQIALLYCRNTSIECLKIKVVFLGKVAPLLKKADRKYLETNIVEMRAFVCLCMFGVFACVHVWVCVRVKWGALWLHCLQIG